MSKKVYIDENNNVTIETFSKEEYDRRPDISLYERKDWGVISKELIYFKLNEMKSHIESIGNININ